MINKRAKITSFDEYRTRYFPNSDLTLLFNEHPEKIGSSLAKTSLNTIKKYTQQNIPSTRYSHSVS